MKPKKPLKRPPCIKIYTTPEIAELFAARAAEQNRSVSKHGEFLMKQDLAASLMTERVA